MKICPITYEEISGKAKYSQKGLKQLSSSLKSLNDFPYTAEEQRREAQAHSSSLSIQGVQPKLSANLRIKDSSFHIVDRGGRYILKPQVQQYNQLPENEDLTMRLAAAIGIEVPLHGLIYSKDKSFTYFIRRFDRKGQKEKLHVEDFAQLTGASRDTKYSSSMEKVAEVLELCSFPAVEKLKLFKRTVFSFLVGNEDMHLKNFSLIVRDEKVELSPAYDLVNSTLVLAAPKEELALSIRGKKSKLTRKDLIEYFAIERLKIPKAACIAFMAEVQKVLPKWKNLIDRSFLQARLKENYRKILSKRVERLLK